MKIRAVAAKQKTLAAIQTGKTKIENRGQRMMRTEGSGSGRQAAAGARVARSAPEKCEMRFSEAMTMMTATMSKRTRAGAVGRRAAEVRMKAGTEEEAGAAVPPRHAATGAVANQRGVKAEAAARGDQTPAMPVTVNEICKEDGMTVNFQCKFVALSLTPSRQLSLALLLQNQRMIFASGTRTTLF